MDMAVTINVVNRYAGIDQPLKLGFQFTLNLFQRTGSPTGLHQAEQGNKSVPKSAGRINKL